MSFGPSGAAPDRLPSRTRSVTGRGTRCRIVERICRIERGRNHLSGRFGTLDPCAVDHVPQHRSACCRPAVDQSPRVPILRILKATSFLEDVDGFHMAPRLVEEGQDGFEQIASLPPRCADPVGEVLWLQRDRIDELAFETAMDASVYRIVFRIGTQPSIAVDRSVERLRTVADIMPKTRNLIGAVLFRHTGVGTTRRP